MRLAIRLRLAYWLDVEGKPIKVLFLLLASSVGAVTFVGSLMLAGIFARQEDGVSTADRALCSLFKGQVCVDVAELTPTEQAQLEFITLACEGGVAEECLNSGMVIWETNPAKAEWLFRQSCDGGNAQGCFFLGFFFHRGIGMDADPEAAARLFQQACEMGLDSICGWGMEFNR